MPKFYIPPERLKEGKLVIIGKTHHHLSRVLRIKPGDDVGVMDGAGRVGKASVTEISRDRTMIEVEGISVVEGKRPRLHLYQAIPKGKKMDRVVQSAVEMDVSSITPFHSGRSVMPGKGEGARLERWRRIAVEASRVAGRAYLPEVGSPLRWEEILDNLKSLDLTLMADEAGGYRPTEALEGRLPGDLGMVVGPEGGFTRDERFELRDMGATAITLGDLILRTETAALALTAAVKCHFGSL
ncbi:MAG: RsmE family RNA methyltransferase [Actinomycetota bacterium]|nr:RsmE family RNA methyltransferase [Actinomycetota bacterium]